MQVRMKNALSMRIHPMAMEASMCRFKRKRLRQAILGFLSGLPESGLLYTVKESEAILRNLIAASCEKSEGEVQYV